MSDAFESTTLRPATDDHSKQPTELHQPGRIPKVREIQFTYENPDDTEFHVRRASDNELHRQVVIDELCRSTVLQVLLADWIHGTNSDGNPASLLFFTFKQKGKDEKRRFQRLEVSIRFEDQSRSTVIKDDPVVHSFWPEGTRQYDESVHNIVTETTIGVPGSSPFNLLPGLGPDVGWKKTESSLKEDRGTIYALKHIDRGERRQAGDPNTVVIVLTENKSTKTGLVDQFRSAVLLRRTNTSNKFIATISARAQVDSSYSVALGFRKLFGKFGVDPILLDPSEPNATMRRDIDPSRLDAVPLEDLLAGVNLATRPMYASATRN